MYMEMSEFIEESCKTILQILKENGIPEMPAVMKTVRLMVGEQRTQANRLMEVLNWLEAHEDKITNEEYRTLTQEIMQKYPK